MLTEQYIIIKLFIEFQSAFLKWCIDMHSYFKVMPPSWKKRLTINNYVEYIFLLQQSTWPVRTNLKAHCPQLLDLGINYSGWIRRMPTKQKISRGVFLFITWLHFFCVWCWGGKISRNFCEVSSNWNLLPYFLADVLNPFHTRFWNLHRLCTGSTRFP